MAFRRLVAPVWTWRASADAEVAVVSQRRAAAVRNAVTRAGSEMLSAAARCPMAAAAARWAAFEGVEAAANRRSASWRSQSGVVSVIGSAFWSTRLLLDTDVASVEHADPGDGGDHGDGGQDGQVGGVPAGAQRVGADEVVER